jgi:hypothetical protein
MSFWRYCEKVALFVGLEATLKHIQQVYTCWEINKTVGECVTIIRSNI